MLPCRVSVHEPPIAAQAVQYMRVLFVNTRYPPEGRAGPAFSVRYMAEQHVRDGSAATVVCRTDRPGLLRETCSGVNILRIGTNFSPQQVLAIFGQALNYYQPEIVHTNLLIQMPVRALGRFIKQSSLKLVHTIREFSLLCPNELMRSGSVCNEQCSECRDATNPLRIFANSVDAAIGVSSFMVDIHDSMGVFPPTTIKRAIHNAYDPPHQVRAPEAVGLPLRLGYLGRLDPMKGVELLLATLSTSLKNRDWTILIGGRGSVAGNSSPEYEAKLRKTYQDPRIQFLGFLDPAKLLSKIDVLVVPSIWQEPFARVTIEAYAHGVPVIGSRRGGIPESIEHGKTGYVFDPETPGDLERALLNILDNPLQLQAMKSNALDKWRREFTPAEIMRQYREVYSAVQP